MQITEYVREATKKSHNRLSVDSVEVLQLHNANAEEVDTDIFEIFDELKKKEDVIEATG